MTELRHAIADFAIARGVSEERTGDIAVAVSEAVTNAVLHAFIDSEEGSGQIEMVAEADTDTLIARVIDDGRGMRPRHDSPGIGIGLPLIGQLARSVDIRSGPGDRGTEVCMVFDAPGVHGPVPTEFDEATRGALLGRIAGITDEVGWPFTGYERMLSMLVPALADACTLDVIEADGRHRRLGAKVAGPRASELSQWLANRRPPPDQIEATLEAHREGRPRLIKLTPDLVETLARDRDDALTMAELPLGHWLNLPLNDGERLMGTLGLGFRPERPDPAEELNFLVAVAERAARGLANTTLIEELRLTSGRFQRILGVLGAAVTVNDERGKVVYANDAAVKLVGASSIDEVLAAEPGEIASRFLISHEDGSPVEASELPGRRVLAGEEAPALLTRSVERVSGREYWMLTRATLLDENTSLAVNVIEDVTEAKTAELRQGFLATAGELLYSPRGHAETLERIAERAVPQLADWCAIDLIEPGGLERVALSHADPSKRELGWQIHRRWPPVLDARAGIGNVIRSKRGELHPQITDEMLVESIEDPDQLETIRQIGMRSAVFAPIMAGEKVLGVISLVNADSRRSFEEDDFRFAEDFGRRAGTAIELARLRG